MNSPSLRLLEDACRVPLERFVSARLGQNWQVNEFKDLIDLASHGCAILSDGVYPVFAKFSAAANALDQFEVELAGLRFLRQHTQVLTPTPLGVLSVQDGVILVLEAAQPLERGPRQWREIGLALARIHKTTGQRFGFETQGYFGPLYQDNRPSPDPDWLGFYAERRLWPRLVGAIDSGHLPTQAIRQVERLITRLPALGIPACLPALLHGDAQQNNFISTAAGAMVVDPAVFYGSPEIDLAHVDYFQAVPEEVFLGYEEEMPIPLGFSARRELWRIPTHLAMLTVGGPDYLEPLIRAVQSYL